MEKTGVFFGAGSGPGGCAPHGDHPSNYCGRERVRLTSPKKSVSDSHPRRAGLDPFTPAQSAFPPQQERAAGDPASRDPLASTRDLRRPRRADRCRNRTRGRASGPAQLTLPGGKMAPTVRIKRQRGTERKTAAREEPRLQKEASGLSIDFPIAT